MDYDWEHIWTALDLTAKRERSQGNFQSPVWDERDRGLYEEDVYLKQCQELDPEDAEDIEKVIRGTAARFTRDHMQIHGKILKSKGYHCIYSPIMQVICSTIPKRNSHSVRNGWRVFSCYVNQLKPESEIYQTILDKYH